MLSSLSVFLPHLYSTVIHDKPTTYYKYSIKPARHDGSGQLALSGWPRGLLSSAWAIEPSLAGVEACPLQRPSRSAFAHRCLCERQTGPLITESDSSQLLANQAAATGRPSGVGRPATARNRTRFVKFRQIRISDFGTKFFQFHFI